MLRQSGKSGKGDFVESEERRDHGYSWGRGQVGVGEKEDSPTKMVGRLQTRESQAHLWSQGGDSGEAEWASHCLHSESGEGIVMRFHLFSEMEDLFEVEGRIESVGGVERLAKVGNSHYGNQR